MKRVRYAGLAPAVVAIMTPAAARAATVAPQAAGARVKTVPLHRILPGRRPAVATVWSSAAGATRSAARQECSGKDPFKLPPVKNIRAWGSYSDPKIISAVCIGKVDVRLHFSRGTRAKPFCKKARVDITAFGGQHWPGEHQLCGTKGTWHKTVFKVDSLFSIPPFGTSGVKVCAASTYHKATCKFVGSGGFTGVRGIRKA